MTMSNKFMVTRLCVREYTCAHPAVKGRYGVLARGASVQGGRYRANAQTMQIIGDMQGMTYKHYL